MSAAKQKYLARVILQHEYNDKVAISGEKSKFCDESSLDHTHSSKRVLSASHTHSYTERGEQERVKGHKNARRQVLT